MDGHGNRHAGTGHYTYIQYRQNAGIISYGLTMPLNKPTMTKKKGKTLEITVNDGANAQIHWPQLDTNRKKSIVMRNT